MELTNDQAAEKLNSDRNILNILGLNKNSGRPPENKKIVRRRNKRNSIPPAVKASVAVLTRTGENQTAVANTFGMSRKHANRIKLGDTPVPELAVEKSLARIEVAVAEKIELALKGMTNEKIKSASLGQQSQLIRSLFPIIDKKKEIEKGAGSKVIIIAPTMKKESDYEMVEA